MIHKACMPVYMNSGKIVADGRDGKIEGSTRGPRGPKKLTVRGGEGGGVNAYSQPDRKIFVYFTLRLYRDK